MQKRQHAQHIQAKRSKVENLHRQRPLAHLRRLGVIVHLEPETSRRALGYSQTFGTHTVWLCVCLCVFACVCVCERVRVCTCSSFQQQKNHNSVGPHWLWCYHCANKCVCVCVCLFFMCVRLRVGGFVYAWLCARVCTWEL